MQLGGGSQTFLFKLVIFFLTFRCFYKQIIHRKSVIYVFTVVNINFLLISASKTILIVNIILRFLCPKLQNILKICLICFVNFEPGQCCEKIKSIQLPSSGFQVREYLDTLTNLRSITSQFHQYQIRPGDLHLAIPTTDSPGINFNGLFRKARLFYTFGISIFSFVKWSSFLEQMK